MSMKVLLQGFVISTVETLSHTSACDLKSIVLPGVHTKQFGCYWRERHLVSPAELNLVQLTHRSTHDSVVIKFCVTNRL